MLPASERFHYFYGGSIMGVAPMKALRNLWETLAEIMGDDHSLSFRFVQRFTFKAGSNKEIDIALEAAFPPGVGSGGQGGVDFRSHWEQVATGEGVLYVWRPGTAELELARLTGQVSPRSSGLLAGMVEGGVAEEASGGSV